MTEKQIELSRRAGMLRAFIDSEYQKDFVDAVRRAKSVRSIEAPYRSWLENPANIPSEKRSKVYDPRSGRLVDRPDADMRYPT